MKHVMKPSKPFANGTEYTNWMGYFCERCNKYKIGDDGLPLPNNCKTEENVAESYIDISKWPKDKIVETSRYRRLCTEFESDDLELMVAYKRLFAEGEDDVY